MKQAPAPRLERPINDSLCLKDYTMEYDIIEDQSRVLIRIKKLEGRHAAALGALEECLQGRCSCPTNQSAKLKSFEVVSGKDSIDVTLTAKDGQRLDRSDLDTCMRYTLDQVSRE